MIKNFLIVLVFVLSACNNSVQEVEIKEVEKKRIINENLLYFDYELKPGVCTSMNASILMKKIGIEIG